MPAFVLGESGAQADDLSFPPRAPILDAHLLQHRVPAMAADHTSSDTGPLRQHSPSPHLLLNTPAQLPTLPHPPCAIGPSGLEPTLTNTSACLPHAQSGAPRPSGQGPALTKCHTRPSPESGVTPRPHPRLLRPPSPAQAKVPHAGPGLTSSVLQDLAP